MHDSRVLLFTKPARPGRVKTRLIASANGGEGGLTAMQAAELHQAFLDDLSERLAAGAFDLVLAWALEEGEAVPSSELPGVRQEGSDLGERLWRALSSAGELYSYVAAIGSDHPELPLAEVESGLALLRSGADAVLGPATDGGYYFVGARSEALAPALFRDIEWSTPNVLQATLERCQELGLGVEFLASGSDVDTLDDLDRFAEALAAGATPACPRTEKLLESWGGVPPLTGAAGRGPA